MALAKLAKAKLKTKPKKGAIEEAAPVKRVEKMINTADLEAKLNGILSLNHAEFTVEEKLKAVYMLQEIDSNIDKIRTIRGELPMEVSDLEDEIAGLETRMTHINDEVAGLNDQIMRKKQSMKDAKEQIKKYESQQGKVKNNREYDSLSKEVEYQNLEIQIAEKRSKEYTAEIKSKETSLEEAKANIEEKKSILTLKKAELDNIVAETQKEESELLKISKKAETIVDERLLSAYKRVRNSARNGLAVVPIMRDACGGCFNMIPPQRQIDIRQHKKIIVCEHCGRILVDSKIGE